MKRFSLLLLKFTGYNGVDGSYCFAQMFSDDEVPTIISIIIHVVYELQHMGLGSTGSMENYGFCFVLFCFVPSFVNYQSF